MTHDPKFVVDASVAVKWYVPEPGSAQAVALPVTLYSSTVLLQAAWEISLKCHHTVYDAIYLALAVAADCPFVTADAAMARAMRATTLREFIRPLTQWTSSGI